MFYLIYVHTLRSEILGEPWDYRTSYKNPTRQRPSCPS